MGSFEEVIGQYSRMIYHIMHSLHIYKNEEEFYQIGMIALWEAYEKFDPNKGEFQSYAYSFIKGRMMTELTKRTRVEERHVYPEETFWEMTVDHDREHPLQLATLLSYCHSLTEKQKRWVVYTFYYGMTIQEIAKKENVSPSAVKKWRAAAIGKIKANIKHEVH